MTTDTAANISTSQQLKARDVMLQKQRDIFKKKQLSRSKGLNERDQICISSGIGTASASPSGLQRMSSLNEETPDSNAQETERDSKSPLLMQIKDNADAGKTSKSARADERRNARSSSSLVDMFPAEAAIVEDRSQNITRHVQEQLETLTNVLEAVSVSSDRMKKLLLDPCPSGVGMMECYFTRNRKGVNKLHPKYRYVNLSLRQFPSSSFQVLTALFRNVSACTQKKAIFF
jgi:hypothetical protein